VENGTDCGFRTPWIYQRGGNGIAQSAEMPQWEGAQVAQIPHWEGCKRQTRQRKTTCIPGQYIMDARPSGHRE